jgi:hypothetical protein
LSVLAAVAAGTVIGIVLASKKGNRAEQNISKKTQALADAGNDKIDEKFEKLLKSVSSEVKKKATHGNQEEAYVPYF